MNPLSGTETIFRVAVPSPETTPSKWKAGYPMLAHLSGDEGSLEYHPFMLVDSPTPNQRLAGSLLLDIAPALPLTLRNPRVTWVEDYHVALNDAMKARLFDYVARLEALDVAVSIVANVQFGEKVKNWFEKDLLTKDLLTVMENPDLEDGCVCIAERPNSGNGPPEPCIEWGPFTLDPSIRRSEWPYPGYP